MIGAAKRKSMLTAPAPGESVPSGQPADVYLSSSRSHRFTPGLSALWTILLLVVTLFLPETRVWGFAATPQPASGVFAPANPSSIGENYDGWQYDASDSSLAAKTPLALPGPNVNAKWGVNNYRHGGEMSAIEHNNYRHAANSGFEGVSRFSPGTSVKNIRSYVDDALRNGNVTPQGTNGFKIEYDLGRTIGTNPAVDAAFHLRIFVRDGNIQTAFPYTP